jgi:hypothetical protein
MDKSLLRTDHTELTWLLSFKNLERQTAPRIQHLQEYIFTSEHRQGRKHNSADAQRICSKRV